MDFNLSTTALSGEDDEALQGAIPHGLGLMLEREPREESIRICEYQTIDRKVAAHSYHAVGFAQMGIGEPQIIV